MRKTMLSLALALVLCLGLALPAAAFDMGKAGTYTTVSTGFNHTGAIDQNGALWMWGNNKYGQLGNNLAYDTEYWLGNYQSVPTKVLDNVVSVSCGSEHTAAIKADGSLWMWGNDSRGQIGVGGNVSFKGDIFTIQTTPKKVMDNVVAVSCGEDFTAAIKSDGTLWMWGTNISGQLGNGGGGNAQSKYGTVYQNVPLKIMDGVAAVSCGWDYAAAIKTDGSLWMWGDGSDFKLGNGLASNVDYPSPGVTGKNQPVPTKVMDGVATVSCGRSHTAAIKTDGSLWVWGLNLYGQIGNGSGNFSCHGNLTYQTTPAKVMDGVIDVGCGEYFTAAAKTDGSLWTWGMNWNGELGNGGKGNVIEDAERRTIHQTVPVKVMDGVAAVSCGNSYTAAIKADGSLWTCGSNSSGQLGNGNKGNFYSTTWPDNPSQDVFGKVMDNIKVPQNTGAVTPAPSVKTAQPTSDALTANGVLQNPTVYNIDGNNYFKIRDLAAILNGTEKQFSVGYDATLKSVTVTTGQSYDKLPTDLTGAPTGGSKTAVVSTDTIYIDGKKVDAQVYMIGGNNYFKLRDLGKALDFYVGWSQGRGVFIETDKPYQD